MLILLLYKKIDFHTSQLGLLPHQVFVDQAMTIASSLRHLQASIKLTHECFFVAIIVEV